MSTTESSESSSGLPFPPIYPPFSRGTDGRFLARYHGITAPRNDPAFHKEARQLFVETVVSTLPKGERSPLSRLGEPLGLLDSELVHKLEQLAWWGLRRKTPWVEIFLGRRGLEESFPYSAVVTLPDGYLVVDAVWWDDRKGQPT